MDLGFLVTLQIILKTFREVLVCKNIMLLRVKVFRYLDYLLACSVKQDFDYLVLRGRFRFSIRTD